MENQNRIIVLRRVFAISVAAFEMQHTIAKAFGYLGAKSYMHLLHLKAQKEINKESPNLEKIDKFLAMMEEEAKKHVGPKQKNKKWTD